MSNAYVRLDQALRDFVEAYVEVEEELVEKFGDDEDSFSHAMVEALETSLEGAVEELDISPATIGHALSHLTEALEQIDPSAFEDEDERYEVDDIDGNIDDIEMDDDDYDEEEEDDYDE